MKVLHVIARVNLGGTARWLDDAWAVRELRDLIGDLRPDVVNTHTAKAGLVGRAAGLSLGSARPALVHTVHGHLLTGYFSSSVVRMPASLALSS